MATKPPLKKIPKKKLRVNNTSLVRISIPHIRIAEKYKINGSYRTVGEFIETAIVQLDSNLSSVNQ